MLSVAEKEYLVQGIKHNIRDDGRSRVDFRPFELLPSELVYASTSTKIQLDQTEILISVRTELCVPEKATPKLGKLSASLICCRHVFPNLTYHELQRISDELTSAFSSIICETNVLDLSSLCIQEGVFAWNVCVDALVISNGGNVLDAAVLGAHRTLNELRIPTTKLKQNRQKEADFDISEDVKTYKPLSGAENLPISVSFLVFDNYFVVDPSVTEELCGTCKARVIVYPDGRLSLFQTGVGEIQPGHLIAITESAQKVGKDLLSLLLRTEI